MIVQVDLGTGARELLEPEDCKRFHVLAAGAGGGGGAAEVTDALGDWAAGPGADDEHVMIRVDAVRRAAQGRVGPGWDDDFGGMLSYASSKGWLDDSGAAIAAHIERAAGPAGQSS